MLMVSKMVFIQMKIELTKDEQQSINKLDQVTLNGMELCSLV